MDNEFKVNLLYSLLVAAASALAFLIYKLYEYYKGRALFNKVAWCVTKDSHTYRCNLHLTDWIHNIRFYSTKKKPPDCFFPNADKLFPISEKYCIHVDEEWSIAKEILEQYQLDLIQKYFSGTLYTDRSITKLTGAEYFLFTLQEFLRKHECDTTFNGNEMYKTKDYTPLGTWGVPLFSATYELTDYAVVYHKVYYIAQMYCLTLRENPLATNTVAFQSAEATKEVIDTREMKVSRY